jgi:phosphonopyruvate decarboxylase
MLDPAVFHNSLVERGIDFFAGVPDSLLKSICGYISDHVGPEKHVIAANEGAAMGLALGYHLATGKLPLVYMQNSGLGNIVNPFTSLADPEVYSIPMLLMIGWRGEPGVKDEPQHVKQGRITPQLLQALEIPFRVLPADPAEMENCLDALMAHIAERNGPAALLVRNGTFDAYEFGSAPDSFPTTREEIIREILASSDPDDVVVGTTGMPSREIYDCRETAAQGHHKDFLTVGGMGHASQIALGIALARPDRRVICLDGDGAAIMHMGSMAIVAASARAVRFKHVLLNNGAHDSVGGQPTVGFRTDFRSVAEACGYRKSVRADSLGQLREVLPVFMECEGPAFLEIRIRKGNRKDLGRPKTSPLENKVGFMRFLGVGPG